MEEKIEAVYAKAMTPEQRTQLNELIALTETWCEKNALAYGDFGICHIWYEGDEKGHIGETVIRISECISDRFAYIGISDVPEMLRRLKAGPNALGVWAGADQQGRQDAGA